MADIVGRVRQARIALMRHAAERWVGMYGIFALIEAVQQLRGEAGERQVAGVNVALAHGNGGTLSSQATAILGTAEAL